MTERDLAYLADRHRITDGKTFRLAAVDPFDTDGIDIAKGEAKSQLEANVRILRDLQERLFAARRHAVLIILQAMDTAGKDSAIEHVMSGLNPQGFQVRSFKAPSHIELDHDFLWRHQVALPPRGLIGIHNRSHYEEVLAVRVHPNLLEAERIDYHPDLWAERYKSIRRFERHLTGNGTLVLKFFLHISKDEQARRILARIDDPQKNWKFSVADMAEREHWADYQLAYDEAIQATARPAAPWYVVPANDKWYARLVISSVVTKSLEALDPRFPSLPPEDLERMKTARAALEQELGLT
ncbi:polyphosphate kinase 2 family protein [Acuticoccus yangtzensis]|uniref:polyphosphate kinase 2 family protein n=1 Tax=Acuticoccus yangtzensis TaxID=1443441 RepID=UPI0009496149|nr:polyphosphate kinase 2 family protein [Acuticoccus yangtzensis]ORE95211.1 hypothetical protein ATO13_00095 [Stappia sp. 22II-S9-Z10]